MIVLIICSLQVDMAVASLLESEISIRRLLKLLDLARDSSDENNLVNIQRWQQVLRQLQSG